MAVVKSNAYGHDIFQFSKLIEKLGADCLGVDSITEALALRKAGTKIPILVLGYTLPECFEEAVKNNISVTISTFENFEFIKAKKLAEKLKIHIKIDTGMHRQGFQIEEIEEVLDVLGVLNVRVEGVYTHFASAKDPSSMKETRTQFKIFKEGLKIIGKTGYKPIAHAAATGGVIIFPESHLDMVRVGIGMYGIWPSKEIFTAYKNKIKLRPALKWKSIISEIKWIGKGEGVGYDFTEKTKRKTKMAIMPVGYWHGYPRLLSSIGRVSIHGKLAKVLGRVSMDMVTVDVTDIKNVRVGDKVTLIGGLIGAENTASLAKTINYEIVTRLNPLIKRIYH